MEKNKKIVIIGAGETAEMAYEYFTYDSPCQPVAFCVEEKYIKEPELFGLPIVPLEKIESLFPPEQYDAFVAVGFSKLNRDRTRLYLYCKSRGYKLVSYISSKAFIWHNVEIGENCFILENNVLQYKVIVGNNVFLWSGNHIGHRSILKDNCFLSSHVVISGFCRVGANCFFGVNSCIADNVEIADDCVIGAGATVLSSTEAGKIYRGNPATPSHISSYRAFNVKLEKGV